MHRRTFLTLSAGLGLGTVFGGLDAISALIAPAPFPVYLTFEGGPSIKTNGTGTTVDVLTVLEKYKVLGTFFVSGKLLTDSHAAVIARMFHDGHAIGNRLYAPAGNLAQDQSTASQLAEQYFITEARLRTLTSQTNTAALYAAQSKLYRRPGGDSALASFLDPANQASLAREPYLKKYVDTMDWLTTVYDYSGWHVSGGQETGRLIKKTAAADSILLAQAVISGDKTAKTQGAIDFLCITTNQHRSHEATVGLIIQLFDSDPLLPDALASIITQLHDKGATFLPLPRTSDKPNTFLVGVEDVPTADDSALACNAEATAAVTGLPTESATAAPTAVATLDAPAIQAAATTAATISP